jgi:hypothetical protein
MIVPVILPRIKEPVIVQSFVISPENMSGLVVIAHGTGQGQIVHTVRSAQRFWKDVI